MAPDHRRPARADEDQTGEPVRSTPPRPRLRHADPAWHRRLGSALNWVGDRVAVVGADPAGAVAAGAAGLPTEPGVVTVVSPLTRDDDWSVVEMVLPIAVPPGSRARLAVADAAGRKLAGRLARELTATVDAPQGDLLLVPGGSLFAVDGWWRHTVDGATAEVGRRCPLPDWEGDLDALCADPGDSPELTLVPVPAGIWAYPAQGEASAPELDDPAYDIPMDVAGPVLVVGRPGHPEPTVAAVAALLDRIPPSVRQRLVLVPYGAATAMVEAGAALAREAGHEVHLRTGLPALTPDGRAASRVVDGTGVGAGLGTGLVLPPVGPASPTGPVRGLDGYPVVEEYVFRLSEHWVAEVTQSGLWVRRAGQETGARVVRGHRWTFGRVRIFVGVPGQPPGHDVLPVLGALLARMPAETRRLVDLVPDEVAVAAPTGDDASSGSTADEAGPVVQRSTVLGRVSATAARSRSVPSSLLSQPVSVPTGDAPEGHGPAPVAAPVAATVPAGPVDVDESVTAAEGALPEDAHDPQPTATAPAGATLSALPDDATAPLQTITAVPGVPTPPAPTPSPAAASRYPSVAPIPVAAKRPRREPA
ncbi:hypothetical protein ABT336_23635, partial [Micromonospora sp. NPDC000207]